VDLKQLKAVVTVAEVGSVTRAAEILHVVPPALTRQIRVLEQELGVPLFERTRQGKRPPRPERPWWAGPAAPCTSRSGPARRCSRLPRW
jgi:DNA-binding transcriptional LysR family regulator